MKRRTFVKGSIALAGAAASSGARGQPIVRRAAVVIGVNKVEGLQPPLGAAVSGAVEVADWLTGEGFKTALVTDTNKPVTLADVKREVKVFVDTPTVEQLVIYFAGHGFVNHQTEYWLLTNALQDMNEAINLAASRYLARQAAITNIVFISDACRTRASSAAASQVQGGGIFPTPKTLPRVDCDIDQFLATRIGDPAYEVPQGGIYTTCLLDAFKRPYPSMVRAIEGQTVLPNRQLRRYLREEVPKRARAAPNPVEQIPDAEICSEESAYIGRVLTAERLAEPGMPGTPRTTEADVASSAMNLALGGSTPQTSTAAIAAVSKSSGFDAYRDAVVRARGLEERIAPRMGFVVSGTRLKAVTASHGAQARFVNSPDGDRPGASVDVDIRNQAVSVVLEFAERTGTALAGLRDFVGAVTVDNGKVTNVSYSPSRQSPLWGEYQHESQRLDRLHADVAAAARLGVLRFEGSRAERNRAANTLADRIRVLKGMDPTLGLYAAYAYAEAGAHEQARSVEYYVRENLGGVDLFDIALLADKLRQPGALNLSYPFCPMLSQGWALLDVKGARLPEPVDKARVHVVPSLWTTFDPVGLNLVRMYALAQR